MVSDSFRQIIFLQSMLKIIYVKCFKSVCVDLFQKAK